MASRRYGGPRVDRRTLFRLTAGAGLATVGGVGLDSAARAASNVTLAIWTGFPELVPFYKAVAADYAKTHPNVQASVLTTQLRQMEQKLQAAVPTGTGPDIYDIGSNITVKFAGSALLDPNPPDVVRYLKGGGWNASVVDFFDFFGNGKFYGLPLMDGSRASMFYNKTMLRAAGIAHPPSTFSALIEAARKTTKFDGAGKMIRSGLSLRLSGQGSGIAEKFRYPLEAVGGQDLIVKTRSGKWHNGYDTAAGRAALQFYVNAVQKWKIDDPKIPHDADAFVAEQTAMLFREAWVIGEIQQKNPKLQYGVAPIPRWTFGKYTMMLQPWGVYVNGKSQNKSAAWDFVKFLTNPANALRLTTMTGWVSERQDVDWKPLLDKTPQFEVFVAPPKDIHFYVEPVAPVWDEIETKLADRLTAAYVDTRLNNNAATIAQTIHAMASETDGILKGGGVYGAT